MQYRLQYANIINNLFSSLKGTSEANIKFQLLQRLRRILLRIGHRYHHCSPHSHSVVPTNRNRKSALLYMRIEVPSRVSVSLKRVRIRVAGHTVSVYMYTVQYSFILNHEQNIGICFRYFDVFLLFK